VTHVEVHTVEKMLEEVKFTHADVTFAKNLFLKDKKKKVFYLLIAKHDTQTDFKTLSKHLKTGGSNIRAGDEDKMTEFLQVKSGSVNLFSILNDSDKQVTLLMDKALYDQEFIGFHPMQCDATTAITKADMEKIIELSGHKADIIDFGEAAEVSAPVTKEAKPKKEKKDKKVEEKKVDEDAHLLGITVTKEDDFGTWYTQVITKSEMIEYYDVSGCYILRPWSYSIWEKVQRFLDDLFKSSEVENVYFPMFVTEKSLKKEESHLEGFAPEVAWVTRSGNTDMPEPIAIRPTSETIMYPAFAKWVQSHRDLPILTNQWTNIVRWEFKHPTPFIRTREFLWQEGHTAHATKKEATDMVYTILEYYARAYEEMYAVPVIRGIKSRGETFAGADFTSTVELFVEGNGRGIQGATSHFLGQNFSKMFDIWFQNENKEKEFAYQTSWGFTTRSVGAMVMVHGDNKGLVLPPRVAHFQVVIVPIFSKKDNEKVIEHCAGVIAQLKKAGIRVKLDDRDNYSSGWKWNNWEVKGVPIRLDIGKRDVANNVVSVTRRFDGLKYEQSFEGLGEKMLEELEFIQKKMYENAVACRDQRIGHASDWETFMAELNKKNLILSPWCDVVACEDSVKDRSKEESKKAETEGEEVLTGSAKTLCKPIEQKPLAEGTKCFACGADATTTALWGRSY
jgi:prolyl-tRNA synthetase